METNLQELGLTRERVLGDYRMAIRSRNVEATLVEWHPTRTMGGPGINNFYINARGQEEVDMAVGHELANFSGKRRFVKWYYRSTPLALRLGMVQPRHIFAQALGDATPGHDLSSHARQMPGHMAGAGDAPLHFDANGNPLPNGETRRVFWGSDTSSTGDGLSTALGLATRPDSRTIVGAGDGSMAEGFAQEAVTQMVFHAARAVIVVMKNLWAISMPVNETLPCDGSVSQIFSGLQKPDRNGHQLKIMSDVEGFNPVAMVKAAQEAFRWLDEGRGPALIEALVPALDGHSSSGPRRPPYKGEAFLKLEEKHDPVSIKRKWILLHGIASEAELEQIEREEKTFAAREADESRARYFDPIRAEQRGVIAACEQVMRETGTNLSGPLAELAGFQEERQLKRHAILEAARRALLATRHCRNDSSRVALHDLYERLKGDLGKKFLTDVYASSAFGPTHEDLVPPTYQLDGPQDSSGRIIAAGFHTLLRQIPRLKVVGQDIGKYLGGVHSATVGLATGAAEIQRVGAGRSAALKKHANQDGFGVDRAQNFAIAEDSMTGYATGQALEWGGVLDTLEEGDQLIEEVQYSAYIWAALRKFLDDPRLLRYRTRGKQRAGITIRTHAGRKMGIWHAGFPSGAILSATEGALFGVPMNGAEEVGMHRALHNARDRDPAIIFSPLTLMHDAHEPVPDNLESVSIPPGCTGILQECDPNAKRKVTMVTYGYSCHLALKAARELEASGVSCTIVNLRWLNPVDLNGLARLAILNTGNVLFIDEDGPKGAMPIIAKLLLDDTWNIQDPQLRDQVAQLFGMDLRQVEKGFSLADRIVARKFVSSRMDITAYPPDADWITKVQPSSICDAVYELFDEQAGPGEERLSI